MSNSQQTTKTLFFKGKDASRLAKIASEAEGASPIHKVEGGLEVDFDTREQATHAEWLVNQDDAGILN